MKKKSWKRITLASGFLYPITYTETLQGVQRGDMITATKSFKVLIVSIRLGKKTHY